MSRSRASQRAWEKEKRLEEARLREIRKKEPPLKAKNIYGVIDLTAYNGIRLLRGEPEKTI